MENVTSKVIFWNIWGHRHSNDIHTFLKEHQDTDVFCLTEVTHVNEDTLVTLDTVLYHGGRSDEPASHVNGFQQLQQQLSGSHALSYDSATRALWQCKQSGTVFNDVGFGSVMAVRRDITVVAQGNKILNLEMHDLRSRVLQWVVYEKLGTRYLVAHFHGVWIEGNTKGDHDARLQQSLQVRVTLLGLKLEYNVDKIVFGGDFNLDSTTRALRDLEGREYRNLINEFSIENTRTKSYRHFGLDEHTMYADYVLVSEPVQVHSLDVHNDIMASDHAPLVVQFS